MEHVTVTPSKCPDCGQALTPADLQQIQSALEKHGSLPADAVILFCDDCAFGDEVSDDDGEEDTDEEDATCFWCGDTGTTDDRTQCDQCDYWEEHCTACGAEAGDCDCMEGAYE